MATPRKRRSSKSSLPHNKAAKKKANPAKVKAAPAAKAKSKALLSAAKGGPPGHGAESMMAFGVNAPDVPKLKAGPTEPDPVRRGFPDFLSEVADAMIATQQKLDLQTEAYLQGSSNSRPLPTLFRMPRLNAQMKFSLEKDNSDKLNLVFYSSTTKASTLQQHSIDFEMVAVPPPPEIRLPAGPFIPLMPRLELMFQRSRRLAYVEKILGNALAVAALGLQANVDPASLPTLLLWELIIPGIPMDGQKPVPTLLMAGRMNGNPPAPKLCYILMNTDQNGPVQVASVEPFSNFTRPDIAAAFGNFLTAAGKRQEELLANPNKS